MNYQRHWKHTVYNCVDFISHKGMNSKLGWAIYINDYLKHTRITENTTYSMVTLRGGLGNSFFFCFCVVTEVTFSSINQNYQQTYKEFPKGWICQFLFSTSNLFQLPNLPHQVWLTEMKVAKMCVCARCGSTAELSGRKRRTSQQV